MSSLSEAEQPIERFLKAEDFLVVVVIIQVFLLITGERIFQIDAWVPAVYLIMTGSILVALVVFSGKRPGEILPRNPRKDPLSRALGYAERSIIIQSLYYMIAFLVSWAVLLGATAYGFMKPQGVMQSQAFGIFLTQVMIVAPCETVVFQGVIPRWFEDTLFKGTRFQVPAKYIFSQVLFAMFHLGAWGGFSLSLMVSTAAFGCLFMWIVDNYGMSAAMGVHSCWNLAVLGLLTGGIIIGA